jgi:hypothetical protein
MAVNFDGFQNYLLAEEYTADKTYMMKAEKRKILDLKQLLTDRTCMVLQMESANILRIGSCPCFKMGKFGMNEI